jgi:hypothetical protein
VNRIIISGEKLFIILEELEAQNDRVYAATIEDSPQQIGILQHFRKPRSMIICETVSIITDFAEFDGKTNAAYQREAILERCLKGGVQHVSELGQWIFQLASAWAHRAKITHAWFRACIQGFSIIT